ncbi:hypothetical protein ECEPECA14_3349 [Escherichia coli EPECa14]|nr:hypothetical protein ECEPECA14_3349 [Escherichia coli EPECa14]EZK19864.1 hypothetical protein AB26_3358 [Escherichia coli 2-011-08_S1_C2]
MPVSSGVGCMEVRVSWRKGQPSSECQHALIAVMMLIGMTAI